FLFGYHSKGGYYMKCPYCNHKIEGGFLKSSHHITWGKEKAMGYQEDDLSLTKMNLDSFFKGFFVKSYYCKDFKKIFISLEEIDAG
ncbi:MAG: PF20097 family protein, partial [Bacillota bacterium]|nr:PF20097 family protein [Bacillota bacterium]